MYQGTLRSNIVMTIWVGDKIKNLRESKGISEEDMAARLNISVDAYHNIEADVSKELTLARLEQIAEILEGTVDDLIGSQDRISNFFDKCQNTHVSNGGHTSHITNYYDSREWEHKVELANLEIEKLRLEKEKLEWELRYWREQVESKKMV